jgi:hypothetical protein
VISASASLDELCARPDDGLPVNLRWVPMHLLEDRAPRRPRRYSVS